MSAAWGEAFPYVAFAQSARTAVRSGPAAAFYVTDYLEAGQKVEVFRHQGDWCAVRPPAGSFSYVAASHVRPTTNRSLLQVVAEGAATRVGSRLSEAHNVEYVKLDPGELLQSLGAQKPLGRSGKLWYRIAPPSGEFRWILRDDLAPQPPAPVSQTEPRELQVPAEAQPLRQSDAAALETGSGVQPAAHAAREIPLQKLGQESGSMQTFPIPTQEEATGQLAESRETQPANEAPTESDSQLPPSAWTVVDAPDQPPPLPSPPAVETDSVRQLAALNLQLSQTVVREMGQWQLAPLREQAQQVLRRDNDPSIRTQALALVRRINEFDALQRRHLEISQPNSLRPPKETASLESTFAGHGWLIPVITSRADLPRYALTDDQGQILQFVTAPPGLNLRRYLRQRVGIVGTPGDASTSNRPYLVANRVVLLDRHERRTPSGTWRQRLASALSPPDVGTGWRAAQRKTAPLVGGWGLASLCRSATLNFLAWAKHQPRSQVLT